MPKLWIPGRDLALPKVWLPRRRERKRHERVPTRREIRDALHTRAERKDGSPYTKASLALRRRRRRLANRRARIARRAER